MKTSFFLNLKYLSNLLFALCWLLAFLHCEETFSSKCNLLSILMPSTFTDFSEMVWLPSMFRVCSLHISWFYLTIIAWNLCAFTIMLFSLNPSVAIWFSLSRVFNSFSTENSADEMVLSSTKLYSSDSLTLLKKIVYENIKDNCT